MTIYERGIGLSTTNGSANNNAIETVNLRRIYKLGDQEVHALRGVNLQVERGQMVALKGRSGSGKTTLLNCIGGLDQPTDGKVVIFGEEIEGWSENKLTKWRRQQVGFIFQSLGLLPALSAYENVELILRMNAVSAKERHRTAVDCLELVGLAKWMDHRPYELTGGQQQRVAIARALANSPKVIIADEPTGDLDSKTGREVLKLFRTIVHERQITMLMATHDNLVNDYVDQVLHLQDGQIVRIEIPDPESEEDELVPAD
jgi:putative ABC transport system ATP-binding protein